MRPSCSAGVLSWQATGILDPRERNHPKYEVVIVRTSCRTVVALLACAAAAPLHAQAGLVEGRVLGVEDSTVIAHALVRLQVLEGTEWVARQQHITSSTGRVRFANVTPGSYRIQLLRIGYRPAASDVVQVRGNDTVRVALRAAAQAVELPAVTVRPEPTCLTATELASDPRVAELWRQARIGVDTRRAFELQYSFRRIFRQEVEIDRRIGGRARQVRVDSTTSIPDSVVVREARRQARNRERGYGSGNALTLPDEQEILDDRFLATHCVETAVEEGNGARALRFRPVSPRRDGVDVRGRIWIDAATYQVRRLELEYLRGDDPYADVAVDYADVTIGGKAIRLPKSGEGSMRASGPVRVFVKGATGKMGFTYDRIEGSQGGAGR